MSQSPHEIRLELLRLAQDQANQRFYTQKDLWEQAALKAENQSPDEKTMLTEVPEFPTTEQILMEADKLKKFIDNK